MAHGVIYKIMNKLDGKVYVGQTTQPLGRRIAQHKCCNLHIDRAIKKYGWKNFVVEVLQDCETLEQLSEREKFWISYFNCKHPNGYNYTDGGEGGWSHSEKTKAIIAEGKYGEKNPNYGKHLSIKERVKKSIANRNDSPYKNLIHEIDKRYLTYSALAKIMELPLTSLAYKIRSNRNFTTNERDKLEEIFDKPAKYLLARDDS